jgi:hypothetical protein
MQYSIFFGDLGPEINEFALVSLFQSRFPFCKPAKVMTDPLTGMSRGYEFVLSMTKMTISVHLSEMQGMPSSPQAKTLPMG